MIPKIFRARENGSGIGRVRRDMRRLFGLVFYGPNQDPDIEDTRRINHLNRQIHPFDNGYRLEKIHFDNFSPFTG